MASAGLTLSRSARRVSAEADSRTRDAVERCLERLSKAATKLGSLADELAPGLPWSAVRAVGNVLRHAYDQVDSARIWEIATGDLPRMAAAAEPPELGGVRARGHAGAEGRRV